MKLVGLRYLDDQKDPSGKLISGCSSLESLVVEDRTVSNDYVGFHTISSSTLKDVKFRLCQPPCLLGYNPEIFCSSLRRLNLSTSRYSGKTISVPVNVFSCKALEQLVLNGHFVICATRKICLPNLTSLALNRVEFEDDETFSRLISLCTSLESLAVKKTIISELNISSCSLKVIEVSLYCSSEPGHKLVINAPALKCLKLSNMGYVCYHIEDLACLEQAVISIRFFVNISSEYCSSVINNAYQALQNVSSLKIEQHCYSNVSNFKHVSLPMFSRLIELDITINCRSGYDLFQKLIINSAKIENLVLKVEGSVDRHWWGLTSVPTCLLSSLRSVSIRSFKGGEDELAMTSYIFANASIMEKMEVCFSPYHYQYYSKMMKKLCKKILNVPRGSEKCVVFINAFVMRCYTG